MGGRRCRGGEGEGGAEAALAICAPPTRVNDAARRNRLGTDLARGSAFVCKRETHTRGSKGWFRGGVGRIDSGKLEGRIDRDCYRGCTENRNAVRKNHLGLSKDPALGLG